ncbi:hypothetical protein SAMCFNEI73_pC0807 (plasmid) [Sinorhizobium americanum]|uniref:Uncharacterized protein n=1 Tax=Sinorhizobium americanum TaxID=194963 RepID=A0A1L3LWW7_9HYPH|nr:hypothetical protein SAMCFNEI73_pC0807 [Sinorhizobium americanum]
MHHIGPAPRAKGGAFFDQAASLEAGGLVWRYEKSWPDISTAFTRCSLGKKA